MTIFPFAKTALDSKSSDCRCLAQNEPFVSIEMIAMKGSQSEQGMAFVTLPLTFIPLGSVSGRFRNQYLVCAEATLAVLQELTLHGKESDRVQVIPLQSGNLTKQVASQMVQPSRFVGGDREHIPACSSKTELDAWQVVEVADSQNSWPITFPVLGDHITNCGLSVEPVQIDVDRRCWNTELHRQSSHGLCLVSWPLAGSTREDQSIGQSGLIEFDPRTHAIGQRQRGRSVGANQTAEDDDDISLSSVVGSSEAVHLSQWKQDRSGNDCQQTHSTIKSS